MRHALIKRVVMLALAWAPALLFSGTEVRFLFAYDPEHPEDPATRAILSLAKEDPRISPEKWGGLILPGAGGRSTFMLALAGGTAPDIYKAWFHILRHDVEKGFVYPLDEFLSPEERAPNGDLWDRVRAFDGHVWALPMPQTAYYGIVYRKDLVEKAGLDPERPPRTWCAFRDWCVRLSGRECRAFAIENRPWGFLPWVQSALGEVIKRNSMGEYEAAFDAPAAVKAAKFLQSLVRLKVIRALPTLTVADEISQLFIGGEIAAVFGGEDLVRRLTETHGFPSELIGLMPFPAADEGGRRVLQAHRHFYAMSESVAHRPPEERELVFKCLRALASTEVADEEVRRNVLEGRSFWCQPKDLQRLGYVDELAALPASIKEMYTELERGEIAAVTEPWVGFWQAASDLIQRKFLGLLLSEAGPGMDVAAALGSITADANRGLMFETDRSRIERARPYARVLLGVLALVVIAVLWGWRSCRLADGRISSRFSAVRSQGKTSARFRLSPWLFLAPAVVSIALWSYYPLIQGALMAFRDYHLVGASPWVGLDNFIRVATDGGFWAAWLRTFGYVALTLVFGFVTPILLAVMLCEIPKGKVFFRFLYFLPHLTSALVVTLLWKLMFDPTENGILNQLLLSVGLSPKTWLLDPAWAMVCCVAPGVWAGAGISSLIYIAALSSLPQDYYEAAAIDGAGILARFRHVVYPQLKPLMVINFVGAFIAAFQGMGSIFLLTFGGPGDATQVVSLQIWKEAYNNLRFSTATTMAWFLGASLVAFTYLQIRFLRKVEFRQAAAN